MNPKYPLLEVGQVIGSWTLLKDLGVKNRRHSWLTLCSCGKTQSTLDRGLKIGTSNSCRSCGSRKNRRKPLPESRAALNCTFGAYKKGAQIRNLPWNLTKEEFFKLTQKACTYCGAEPANRRKSQSTAPDFIYNGVDRLKNKKGYEPENVVTCCRRCNKFKGSMDIDEFKALVSKISGYTGEFIGKHRLELMTQPGFEWLLEKYEQY